MKSNTPKPSMAALKEHVNNLHRLVDNLDAPTGTGDSLSHLQTRLNRMAEIATLFDCGHVLLENTYSEYLLGSMPEALQ